MTTERPLYVDAEPLGRWTVLLLRVLLAAAFVAAWQWLPEISPFEGSSKLFDRFFVSSPEDIALDLRDLLGFGDGAGFWSEFFTTMRGTIIGCFIALTLGCVSGLVFSTYARIGRILGPFIDLANSMPTVAVIPIFVIALGPTDWMTISVAVFSVYFFAHFTALAGARSVPRETVQNARLLGASHLEALSSVRLRYALVWTCATLSSSVGRALVVVFSAELLSGAPGLGRLMLRAMLGLDASMLYALVIVLSTVGMGLSAVARIVSKPLSHWHAKT